MKRTYNKTIGGETPVLIDFYADWCSPCQTMEPIFKALQNHYGTKLKLLKIDVDKNKTLALNFGIRSVPTTILYKNETQVWRRSGLLSKRDLKEAIDRHQ